MFSLGYVSFNLPKFQVMVVSETEDPEKINYILQY